MLFDPYTYDLTISAGQAAPARAQADDLLLEVPHAARATLWQGLTEAVEGTLDLWELLPAGFGSAPLPPSNIPASGAFNQRRYARKV